MKRRFRLLLAWIPAAILIFYGSQAVHAAYTDVPEGALGNQVRKAIEYKLMNGLSDTFFGYSTPMTRAQFVTVLDRMLLSGADSAPLPDAMNLPDTLSETYRNALSHAVACEVVDSSVPFRPGTSVTREDMAEMLVKALGLNNAALSLSSDKILSFDSDRLSSPAVENPTPFRDLPAGKEGYAIIAYAIGMTKGLSKTTFGPDATATRAQAAAMLTRIYEKIHQQTGFRHIFYDSSTPYSVLEMPLDAVSVEWSRITWNNASAVLMTKASDSNDSEKILETLTANGTEIYLSVFMDVSGGVEKLLVSENGRAEAVQQIFRALTARDTNSYSGVTVDFRGLRQEYRAFFTQFLSELKDALSLAGKRVYVCVAPYRSAGDWDDGYDYRAISHIADKLILSAYGYHSENLNNFLGTEAYKNEAPAPLDYVYLSLRKLTEAVPDTSKLVLGISFRHTAWEIGQDDDQLLSGSLVSPDTETLRQYLRTPDTTKGWSIPYQMPYAVYRTREGTRYFVWYENDKSAREKADIAHLLGVTGISYCHVDFDLSGT